MNLLYKYVNPPYCRRKMYAGCIACCPLVNHTEYADGTDHQMDGRQTVILLCFCEMRSA